MWYDQERWKKRLGQEVAVMEERFPALVLRRRQDGTLWWEGIVVPIPDIMYRVAVIYPSTYPYVPPSLRLLDPQVERGAPHVYQDGSLCIHKKGSWNAATGTAASMVPLLAWWLFAYTLWRVTGEEF
jgi:ubiquitin-protein ligase